MPKFKIQHKIDNLKEQLIDMGLVQAFSSSHGNFTKIFEGDLPPLMISRVIHEALIEVDEKGTEAAAATVVEIVATSMPVGPTQVTLDKPFYFLIKEKSSEAILFMGKLSDPSKL